MRRFQVLTTVAGLLMFHAASLAAWQTQPPPPPPAQAPVPTTQTARPGQPPQTPPPQTPPGAVSPAPLPTTVTPAPASGRGPQGGRGRAGTALPIATQTPQPQGGRGAAAMGRPARPEPAIMQNVRLDLTITDSFGTSSGNKKTVTMIVVNEHNGRIRSSNEVRQPLDGQSFQFRPVTINVDATPYIRADGRVQLSITLEYIPELQTPSANSSPRPATVNESLTVLLQDGKSMLISQSADPSTDRRVTVDITATVMK